MIFQHLQKNLKTMSNLKVGQVKGIFYPRREDCELEKPTRVTAEIETGTTGAINIDRESRASSPFHGRGLRILGDYLKANFAQSKQIGISANISFEQPCGIKLADSASSAELYALLSRIAQLPIRQDIAVTGLVNQKGEIQVSDGLNYKIEVFFDICRVEGLTGLQGVMIPQAAVPDMMLRRDVIQAIENLYFHLIPVRTVDEGIQFLSGVDAGEKDASGEYPAGSVKYMVKRRLQELSG